MATKEPKKSVAATVDSDAKQYVDYCDIAECGMQSIFDGLMGIANNLRSYTENVASRMHAEDLRAYINGMLNQLDGLTEQASTINDGLIRYHDVETYNKAKQLVDAAFAKEHDEAVTKQRVREMINDAKKFGYLHELQHELDIAMMYLKPHNKGTKK